MWKNIVLVLTINSCVIGYPYFDVYKFKVGIEYEHSLPMTGGSDRYRHRNNYDPFFVTVTATAKKNYVISYIEVKATVDVGGDIDFTVIRGKTGSRTMVFQLVSNHSDFLSYNYITYGIREEQYKKLANIINLPMSNKAGIARGGFTTIISTILFFLLVKL